MFLLHVFFRFSFRGLIYKCKVVYDPQSFFSGFGCFRIGSGIDSVPSEFSSEAGGKKKGSSNEPKAMDGLENYDIRAGKTAAEKAPFFRASQNKDASLSPI